MCLGNAQLPRKARSLNGAFWGRAGAAVVAGDEHHLRPRLGDAGGDGSHPRLGHQLHADAGAAVCVFQVVYELLQILNGVNVMMGRGRDQRHARRGAAGFGNPGIDLGPGEVAALAGLGSLRHFNLNFLGAAKVFAGHAKPGGGDLFDGGVAVGAVAGGVLAALAGVGLSADAVHGECHALMGLLRNGAVAHGSGFKAPDDGVLALHFVDGDAAALVKPKIQHASQGMGLVGPVHLRGVFPEGIIASLPRRLLQQQNGAGVIHVVLLVGAGAQLQGPGGIQRGVIAKAQGVEGPVVVPLHALANLCKAHAPHPADGVGKIPVDHGGVDTHALENLGGLVGLNGGNAHFGGNFHDAVENGAVVIADGGAGVLVQKAHRHQLRHAFLREIGIHGLRAIAQQRGKMMHVPRLRAFQNHGQGGALLGAHQMLLQGGNRQKGGDGHVVFIHAPVGENQDIRPLAVSPVAVDKQAVQRVLQGHAGIV
ncbi:hypothetical protein SDC9_99284 [bioreactor metagenome]|uniref:Uncharacterized protein n=1 Tax=bioreactor metagenome TaxID=1076179 RepID=A0A645ASG0_9ZZZZ